MLADILLMGYTKTYDIKKLFDSPSDLIFEMHMPPP
jgi:hypothetical protein